MPTAPRLRLELRPSRRLRRLLGGACAATAACAACLPLPWAVRLVLILAVLLIALRAVRTTLGRGLPAVVHLGADRTLTATGQDGRSKSGVVRTESYVGPRFTIVVWRADTRSGLLRRGSATLLVLPDMLPPEEFRQLRVLLRYGRAQAASRATSGATAGRPASQAAAS
jgi:hypothetical protein